MRDAKLSRRHALTVLGAVPVAAALAACGKKSEPDSCSDVSALSDADKTGRTALQYVDKSTDAAKRCEVCSLYQPAPDAAQCGGCQVVKGPIHPKGYCNAFAAKA
jgi:High potential iron-sulfur protein